MKEFDQLKASESQIDDQESGDELYEDIEAPKFVDFTVPDHYHPDDRYWFCLRVGCDQKHEEELDLEEINKNFILRVMAARSPNIKIRKMLDRKQQSSTLKCPLTAPAKRPKSRISRLALVSSISRKLIDAKDKTKPLSKLTATPKANSKQSSSTAAKAFTTPRNRKKISNNTDKFRSVRNPKLTTSIVVPKNRVIAKALVFNSAKKVVRVKTSLEIAKTPVGKLCAAMSKLEIATGKKRALELKGTPVGKLCAVMSKLEIASGKKQALGYNKTLPTDKSAKKQLRGREIKSRVFDSLHSQTQKGQETKPLKNMKRKKGGKNLEQFCDLKENDSSDTQIDRKSSNGSLAVCSVPDNVKNCEATGPEVSSETSRVDIPTASASELKALGLVDKTSEQEEKSDSSEAKIGRKDIDNDDKENALPSDLAEDEGEIHESDEKENTSASDDNREPNNYSEEKILTNHDLKKVNQVTKKLLKKSYIASTLGAQEAAKYRKPKPTHPKPFRLRTDERGILKEANLEKKFVTPLKEIAKIVKPSEPKSSRKNPTPSQSISNKTTRSSAKTVTPVTLDKALERKSHKNLVRRQGTGSSKKTARLGVIKERSTNPSENLASRGILKHKEAVNPSQNLASQGILKHSGVPTSVSRGRMPTTIPKEPNFHSIRVPKSCTRKVT